VRQSIPYIISAVLHIAVVALLLLPKDAPENEVVELPKQLTIDLDMLSPVPTTALVPKQTPQLVQKPKPIPKAVKPKKKKPKPPVKPIAVETKPVIKAVEPVKQPTVVENVAKTVVKEQPKAKPVATGKPYIVYNPSFQKQRPIKYPKSARRKKLEGTVTIRADIDSKGYVKKAWVQKTSGHKVLDNSALKSVKRWIFTPAQRDGVAKASTVQFPVVFELK